ncbi:MAG: hypothetical protein EBU90_13030 [Proteobacteria bacterium]|nr:hypothetical protein [Pseudomonadota bacterium]NBP15486.1 hypothetical protein [bacterium]
MKILILGGTKFVGKDIAGELIQTNLHEINFLNRGITDRSMFSKYKTLIIDRNIRSETSIKNFYDLVIDVSCYNLNQLINVLDFIDFDRYIFISSSAVKGIPFQNVSPDMYEMAQYAYKKKECEDFIINNFNKYLIFRPCYLVGEGDYTNRFYVKNGEYFWKNGSKLDYYMKSKDLASLINQNICFKDSKIISPCD